MQNVLIKVSHSIFIAMLAKDYKPILSVADNLSFELTPQQKRSITGHQGSEWQLCAFV
jgi:hypothetical protein